MIAPEVQNLYQRFDDLSKSVDQRFGELNERLAEHFESDDKHNIAIGTKIDGLSRSFDVWQGRMLGVIGAFAFMMALIAAVGLPALKAVIAQTVRAEMRAEGAAK